MIDQPSRRDVVKRTARLAALSALGAVRAPIARAKAPPPPVGSFSQIDTMLRAATRAGELPGVVALAATEHDIVYEGVFGARRLHEGPLMTRDTVFRIASMVKLITSVAALQLVEQGKLSLDAPVPDIDPALGSPQVLDGFDPKGAPQLRPAKRPISLRHLLTHTSGLSYRLWDAKAARYAKSIDRLPAAERSHAPHTPLMFDPGERWQYGPSIDWVGRIVESVSGERLDVYFRNRILDPLGMNDTGFLLSAEQRAREASMHKRGPIGTLAPQPVEQQAADRKTFSGGGGIYSSAPDYLSLVRMLLRGGSLDGVRILRPETVALMDRNQIGAIEAGVLKTTAPALSNDVDFFPGVSLKWGLGHMINMQPIPQGRSAGSLTWAGLLNTYYWIDPARRVAAVFMTQVLPFADTRALRIYRQFERGIYAALRSGAG
ncbi:MAG TPA: serine hydrolase domain-containing protein [Xanthobacteraceae bacterium]|jgi:CubicO group peptidase (beta-lactamase class C family)